MKAIQIQAFGNPIDVARCVDLADVGAPDANEVVVALEASPINQYDLLMIGGGYGYRPPLPAIVGTEGVGRVIAVGAGVKHLKEGDRTLVPFLHPTWAERVKTNAPWLRALPPGDVNQFAMMGVNPPTAYLLLKDMVKLPRGSWVIQNGANSGVGRATVAIAKSLGLRTVNVVRRDEVVAEVKALGGDVVLVDGPDLAKCVGAETGSAPITLALDGVSDTSPMNLMSCLSESGVLVSYGGTSRKPMVVHPGSLIFKKQTIRGFSTGTSQPSRMRSRQCSIIWRRWSLPARSRPPLSQATGSNRWRKRSRKPG
jgi:NADPH:quinone reductase-like Zn-dependent oxidoreductase